MSIDLTQAAVLLNDPLCESVRRIRLHAPSLARTAKPGQFVQVRVSESLVPMLRRPFGVAGADREAGDIDLIYRVIGTGTQTLSEKRRGDTVSIVGPLGHGFDLEKGKTLLVGGGLGLAPLLFLAQEKSDCDLLMGARTATELFWTELYEGRCAAIHLTTDDGSRGTRGTVMALLPELLRAGGYGLVCVCGPTPMMQAVADACDASGIACQVSLERYMACGLGACLSCAFEGAHGRLKVCQDGPVFWSKEIREWR